MAQETKKEKREAARKARLEAELSRKRAQQKKRFAMLAVVTAVVLLAGYLFYQQSATSNKAGEAAAKAAGCGPVKTYPELTRAPHIAPTDPPPKYNSTPPTSGQHFAQPAQWGSHDDSVDNRIIVHNLEHGGVIINYKDVSPSDVDKLNTLADSFDDGVVAQPNKDITSPVVLTSWRTLQACKKVSVQAIRHFISAHCNKAPEKFGLKC